MKIMYTIFADAHGRGGHYHSLYETAKKVESHTDICVASIGQAPSPVLKNLGDSYTHYSASSLLAAVKILLKVVKKEKPDVIHSFDAKSYFFGRIASFFTKTPILLTKCGGANPTYFYPYCENIVLYSVENFKFFKQSKKFNKTNFYLIPNRVSINKNEQDLLRIDKIKSYLPDDYTSILRIARISSAYERSIQQAINLTLKLLDKGHKVKLIVIGVVQDEIIYNKLLKFQSENIIFLTSDEFTVNASEIIDFADIVLGTGRSFMEAALLGKKMLVPCENLNLPILVDKLNIDYFFSMNFSPRINASITNEDAFNAIEEVILKKNFNDNFVFKFAKENFSSNLIYKKHISLYENARIAKINPADIILHLYFIRKTFK